jgi:hypothetical protein
MAQLPPIPISCVGGGCPNWLALPEALSGYTSADQCFFHASVTSCIESALILAPIAVKALGVLGDVGNAARAAADAGDLADAGQGVWSLGPAARGVKIEQMLGHNVPSSFPKIDVWDSATGTATSIKSVDLAAQTYQDASTLGKVLNTYVDNVAGFQGDRWGGLTIEASQIQNRALTVAIPDVAATYDQWTALYNTYQYGVQQGFPCSM